VKYIILILLYDMWAVLQ